MQTFYITVNTVKNTSTIQMKFRGDYIIENIISKKKNKFPLKAVLSMFLRLYSKNIRKKIAKIELFEIFAKL